MLGLLLLAVWFPIICLYLLQQQLSGDLDG